jgi:hypothetical protein
MTLPMHTTLRKLLCIAGTILVGASPLAAQTTTIGAALTTSVGPFTRATSGFQSIGQSFTVPPITTQLATFSLSLSNFFNGSAVRFDAYLMAFDTATRRVTGSALWSSLNQSGSGNDFAFDMRTFNTGNVNLMAGSTYLFLLSTSAQPGAPEDAGNLVGASDVDAYAGGSLWIAANGGSLSALQAAGAFSTVPGAADIGFTAVFTSAQQVVPEPANVLLTGAGLCLLVLIRYASRTRWR